MLVHVLGFFGHDCMSSTVSGNSLPCDSGSIITTPAMIKQPTPNIVPGNQDIADACKRKHLHEGDMYRATKK